MAKTMLYLVLGASYHIYIGGVEGASRRRPQVGRILLGSFPSGSPLPYLSEGEGKEEEEREGEAEFPPPFLSH